RMTAFNDAMEKMLWPDKRLGKETIKVTGKDTVLKIRSIQIRVPAGTPIDLLANINVYNAIQIPALLNKLDQLLSQLEKLVRLFRSSISGRFDNYNGSGTQARINWEESFARGGIGAIISSFCPVHIRGRILPNYAMIDNDDKIPFWRAVGETVHRYDCKFIL